jgi:hypothetical protein
MADLGSDSVNLLGVKISDSIGLALLSDESGVWFFFRLHIFLQ